MKTRRTFCLAVAGLVFSEKTALAAAGDPACVVAGWMLESAQRGLYDNRSATITRAMQTIAKLDAIIATSTGEARALAQAHQDAYRDLLAHAQTSRRWSRKTAVNWALARQQDAC